MTPTELIFEVHEDEVSGYWAQSLGHNIVTQGETVEELKSNIRDAISISFDEGEEIPKIVRLHFVRDEVFSL
ncbi:MAG TPA: 2-oxoisovalerate dehydrogenase [bacterium]|jgi:predicted RNase H-like HicB family nuclease